MNKDHIVHLSGALDRRSCQSLIDTFESGLSILLPGLPSMLANLYESFYNMQLFLKDLIS